MRSLAIGRKAGSLNSFIEKHLTKDVDDSLKIKNFKNNQLFLLCNIACFTNIENPLIHMIVHLFIIITTLFYGLQSMKVVGQ